MPDRARAEAARADARLRRGGAGPLVGIPFGVKDVIAARGAPTTWGAPHFRTQTFPQDATAVARVARAGAVLIAKLATVELAGAGSMRRPGGSLQGQPRNAWSPDRYSGGSSSGPALAVSTGVLPFALGTETGGSIQSPASYSGVSAIRPTYGLVPRTGVMPLAWTLDKVGVLGRTVTDCATALEIISGPDRTDPTSSGRFRRMDASDAKRAARGARIGIGARDIEDCAPVTHRALGDAVAAMQRVIGRSARTELRADLPYDAMLDIVMYAEVSSVFSEQLERGDFELVDAKQKAYLERGLQVRARDYLHAMRLRALLIADFKRVFSEVDVLVAPGRSDTAPLLDGPAVKRSNRTNPDRLRTAANLAGLPGVIVPAGIADDGLPVGLHILGPWRSEPLLVAIGEAFQRATAHHERRPPLAL